MTTKDYLQQAFYLDESIKTNQFELERLRELSVSVQTMKFESDRIKINSPTDKISDIVARITDLEAVIQSDINRYIKTKEEILKVINSVEDDKLKLILQKRYINFKKWEQIAFEMNYADRWVRILHEKALKAVEKHILLIQS